MPSITEAPYEPADSRLSQRTAQAQFLLLIEDLAPQVLKTLAAEPFERFKLSLQILASQGKEYAPRWLLQDHDLCLALSAWASEFGLVLKLKGRATYNWVEHAAVVTMLAWQHAKGEEERKKIGQRWCDFNLNIQVEPLPDDLRYFKLKIENRSHPTDGKYNREHVRRMMQRHFDEAVEEYLFRLEEYVKEVAANPEQFGLRKSEGMHNDSHLRWVIYNRCLKLPEAEIKERYATTSTVENIKDKIRDMEKLLGLPSIKQWGGSRPGKRKREKSEPKREDEMKSNRQKKTPRKPQKLPL